MPYNFFHIRFGTYGCLVDSVDTQCAAALNEELKDISSMISRALHDNGIKHFFGYSHLFTGGVDGIEDKVGDACTITISLPSQDSLGKPFNWDLNDDLENIRCVLHHPLKPYCMGSANFEWADGNDTGLFEEG